MEMTEYGKHGKPRSRLSTLPTLLGNPFGITTFPRPRLLAYFKVQKHERPNPRQLDLKGVVTQVLGPKCNERSSTLIPLAAFAFVVVFQKIRAGVAGRTRGCYETLLELRRCSARLMNDRNGRMNTRNR
jgi:hypothetical protein